MLGSVGRGSVLCPEAEPVRLHAQFMHRPSGGGPLDRTAMSRKGEEPGNTGVCAADPGGLGLGFPALVGRGAEAQRRRGWILEGAESTPRTCASPSLQPLPPARPKQQRRKQPGSSPGRGAGAQQRRGGSPHWTRVVVRLGKARGQLPSGWTGSFLSHPADTIEHMFAIEPAAYSDIDAAEHELVRLERVIARARARQLHLLSWLDAVKVARVHGSRSLEEWTAAHLDVTPTTAKNLVTAARARDDNGQNLSGIHDTLDTGEISFDRAAATTDLAAAGASKADIEASLEVDLTRVRRQTARFQRITRIAEREVVAPPPHHRAHLG